MIPRLKSEEWNQQMMRLRLVSGAMLSSVFIYGVVVALLAQQEGVVGARMEGEEGILLKYILGVAGADLVPLPLLLRSLLLSPEKWGRGFICLAGSALVKENPALVIQMLFSWYLTRQVICLAAAETPALLGLVIFFVSGDQVFSFALLGASLVSMLLVFPRESWLVEALEKTGATRDNPAGR